MEICLNCQKPSKEPAAYLTSHRLPVCAECLPELCERYSWDRDSRKLRRAKRESLERLNPISPEEREWRIEVNLSSLLPLYEGEIELSADLINKVGSILEARGILALEAM
ncbi:MAG: hypothetical protein QXJ75_02465 [Candidatus Bathyarchaeia archaeon]